MAVEVEYRLDASQVGNSASDLDNLVKTTIDALDGVFGPRPGKWRHPQPDDERVDKIIASKRTSGSSESAGATLVVREYPPPA